MQVHFKPNGCPSPYVHGLRWLNNYYVGQEQVHLGCRIGELHQEAVHRYHANADAKMEGVLKEDGTLVPTHLTYNGLTYSLTLQPGENNENSN